MRRRTGATAQMSAVLHIGNIANNAYQNAKILRRAGLSAMFCAMIITIPWDAPNGTTRILRGYRRPVFSGMG